MVRLSSKDASLLMDLLEQTELSEEERLRLLEGADKQVHEIGKALIHPDDPIEDPDIKEAVDSIRQWADTTKRVDERLYA
jgi:hypothetical protein